MPRVTVRIDKGCLVKITCAYMQRLVKVFDIMRQQTQRNTRRNVGKHRLSFRLSPEDENARGNGMNDIVGRSANRIVPILRLLERNVREMKRKMVRVGGFELRHFRR